MNKIVVIQNNHIIAHAKEASSFFLRLKGLLGKDHLPPEEALILSPCTSVHTFFMKFSIDVVFLNSSFVIIALYSHLKPNRMTWLHWNAKWAIEFSEGTIEKWNLKKGETLKLEESYV